MKKHWSLMAIGAALLAACGGGGGSGGGLHVGNEPPPPETVAGSEVPVSATTDANAAFAFVASASANKSESADPLVVGSATLATTDTEEPKSF